MTTTFYMEGCVSSDDQAVKYFDEVYLPIQEMIDFDNEFQEAMQLVIIASDDISNQDDTLVDEMEYDNALTRIDKALTELSFFVDEKTKAIQELNIYNNEVEIQRAALSLFSHYRQAIDSDFKEMQDILKKESPTEADNKRFNTLLKSSNTNLDYSLQSFYDIAIDYGERNNIDLEFDEE